VVDIMTHEVKIEALDHFGCGIAHLDNKVIFVKNALPGEIVQVNIIREKKNYSEAVVRKYIRLSSDRIESICPYFELCGGCNLLFYPYAKTLDFKRNKVKELLQKNKISYSHEIQVIENPNPFYYRNKISLKIIQDKIGFYEENTHRLVEIQECKIANPEINQVIQNYSLFHIHDGNLTIRCNTNHEILIIIDTLEEDYCIELEKLKKIVKLVGIVYNHKTIYGDNFLYERIGGMLFKVSYNSFFQVNPFICEKLFSLVSDSIDKDSLVLDLYSGVGTLSMVASAKAKEVFSVEIIKNAVVNGIFNAKLNHRNNIQFMLGDVAKIVDKIGKDFDTFIVDPPRKGLDLHTIEFIKRKRPKKLIYISCDVNTLMRDLKSLEDIYEIQLYKVLDMFSFSYHLESFVVLETKGEKYD